MSDPRSKPQCIECNGPDTTGRLLCAEHEPDYPVNDNTEPQPVGDVCMKESGDAK